MRLRRGDLGAWCRSLVDDGQVSAVAVALSRGDGVPLAASAAQADDGAALFDLASLTKPLTATLALVLDQAGDVALSTRVGDVWSGAGRIAAVPLERLLRHESGLRRWMPLYATCVDEAEVARRLLDDTWLVPDQGAAYSDLDYILWCLTIEKALGRSYGALLSERVLEPLGVEGFSVAPPSGSLAAVCRLPTTREVELARGQGLAIEVLPAPERGQPQDGNCRFLGRPVGHAGVFADADAMWRLGREWCLPGDVLSPDRVDQALGGPGKYALGWYRYDQTAAGRVLGPSAVGHDGFTGGTLWIDPSAGLTCVALCHRASLTIDLSSQRTELTRALVGS